VLDFLFEQLIQLVIEAIGQILVEGAFAEQIVIRRQERL
jgi:hypothetical protein